MNPRLLAANGPIRHFDDAYANAVASLGDLLQTKADGWRALLIADLTGRLRIILWCPPGSWDEGQRSFAQAMISACGPYWSGDVVQGRTGNDHPDASWQEEAWDQAERVEGPCHRLRTMQRHRAKSAWFDTPNDPPWPGGENSCTIALFYSFKGGVGRSTALAAVALRLAADGERVVVVDADFDAPGVGSFLPDHDGATSRHGAVDYLLEQPVLAAGDADAVIDDYLHRCSFTHSGIDGEILVLPAGTLNTALIHKLARVGYARSPSDDTHPCVSLLQTIRKTLEPSWILVDSQAGLGEISGLLTSGLCHINVLFGALAEASWHGVGLVLGRLGASRMRGTASRPQAECVWVASMVPRREHNTIAARFQERSRDLFSESYYADPSLGDKYWTLDDLEDDDAPHVPVTLLYDSALADIANVNDVAEHLLQAWPYKRLVDRLRTCRRRLP